jgi:hypothetical protein
MPKLKTQIGPRFKVDLFRTNCLINPTSDIIEEVISGTLNVRIPSRSNSNPQPCTWPHKMEILINWNEEGTEMDLRVEGVFIVRYSTSARCWIIISKYKK